jgi:hypothetical protein
MSTRIEIRYVRPARFAVFSKASIYNRLRGLHFDAAQGGGSWVSPCRPSPARQ